MKTSRRQFARACAALGFAACARRGDDEAPPPTPAPLAPTSEPADVPEPRVRFHGRPDLAARVPFVDLGGNAVRFEQAAKLGAALGVGDLWLARDDLSCPLYGGGKRRKLEVALAAAVARGATSVVTFGGVGSNQAVAAALFGRALGLGVQLFLAPQPGGPHVRANLLASAAAGAELRFAASVSSAEAEVRRATPAGTYVVPPGASEPVTNLAFVDAALELAAAIRGGACPKPDVLVVPLGTGGTAVGLGIGLRLAGLDTRVVAVRASNPATSSRAVLEALWKRTAAELAERIAFDLDIDIDHLGGGYGRTTAEGARLIAMARDEAGLALEPVYGAKALAAASAHRGRTVLFWCTHNAAALELAEPAALPAAFRPWLDA